MVNHSDNRASRTGSGRRQVLKALGAAGVFGLAGYTGAAWADDDDDEDDALSEAAQFDGFHITGVAVSGDGRLFVNQPRFPWAVANEGNRPRDADDVDASVVEVTDDGLVAYPNEEWNNDGYDQVSATWREDTYPAAEHFVNVQSVYVDPDNPHDLWVLDTGNPELSAPSAIVDDGPKLVQVDTTNDEVVKTVFFDGDGVDGDPLTPERDRQAYLNDVRVTADQRYAVMTDSELGALVVADLGKSDEDETVARRLFDDEDEFPSTHAEDIDVLVGPHEAQEEAAGPLPPVHSDGIAIDPDDERVYYHALTGRTLWSIETEALTDALQQRGRPDREFQDSITSHGETDVTDGMIADDRGVYHSDLEDDAITRWNYGEDGTETIVQDPDLVKWPDSFAFGPDGDLYFTTSKIHLESSGTRRKPFKVLKIGADDL